jgi:hypothetical protein
MDSHRPCCAKQTLVAEGSVGQGMWWEKVTSGGWSCGRDENPTVQLGPLRLLLPPCLGCPSPLGKSS